MSKEAIEELPSDVATLQSLLLAERKKSQELVSRLEQRIAELLKQFFAKRRERFVHPNQLMLFDLDELTELVQEAQQEEKEQELLQRRRGNPKGHGRRELPEHLPREVIRHELAQEELPCPCCGTPRTEIGCETSQQLEFIPAQLKVLVHERVKYACKTCQEQVVIAPVPGKPIEKGLPGPGLLAQILLSKYGDHTPLYRQEDILARSGVILRRSTLCDWVAAASDLLIGEITSAMRSSSLAQGDAHAIRGLLQLLGELFRGQGLADAPVGTLITLDQVYDVQRTALSSDTQNSMTRILNHCAGDGGKFKLRVAKAVALLELVQEKGKYRTDAKLVAQCLHDRLDRGSQVSEVAEALEALHRAGLLSYAEKTGYKIQSTAGEEWDRERKEIGVGREMVAELAQEALKRIGLPSRPSMHERPFRWETRLSDGRQIDDAVLVDPRDDAAITVDFRLLFEADERQPERWVRSNDPRLHNRLVWVCGDTDAFYDRASDLACAREMVKKYDPRRESLQAERKLLLQQEKNNVEDLVTQVQQLLVRTFLSGQIYFRGEPTRPADIGDSFERVLATVAARYLPKIYPHHIATQVAPSELEQLLKLELTGPPEKFLLGDLGILALDAGRFVFACSGTVPTRVLEYVTSEGAASGQALLAHFGGPPYGYTPNVLRACVLGLLRAKRVKIRTEGGATITDLRDAGAHDTFDKDRNFRRATFSPADDDPIGLPVRAKICDFFKKYLKHEMDREDSVIADAVAHHFPLQAPRLRAVFARLAQLPGSPTPPAALTRLQDALEQCLREIRQTQPTLKQVKKHLDVLRDGVQQLGIYESELTQSAIDAVREAARVREHHAVQLRDTGTLTEETAAALQRVEAHLATERPWREIGVLDGDLGLLRDTYSAERRRLLQWQEQEAERARAAIKAQPGFSTLTAEQAHRVLRPFAAALTTTSAEAIAPTLRELFESFKVALERASAEAQDHLDRILFDRITVDGPPRPRYVAVDLGIKNRHLATEADVEALLADIREKLLAQLRAGTGARIA